MDFWLDLTMTNPTATVAAAQPGILAPPPPLATYLLFQAPEAGVEELVETLSDNFAEAIAAGTLVVGLGSNLLDSADSAIGYHRYQQPNDGYALSPANPADLAIWLRGSDRGELLHLSRNLVDALGQSCRLTGITHGFTYKRRPTDDDVIVHDLSGFEDGTENPQGQEAVETALLSSSATHLNGGSLWALQSWQHNFEWLNAASDTEKEQAIGRSLLDNHELDDNSPWAHVARTEQESFAPEAHMLRRSMPWCDDQLNGGLMFSSFAHSLYPFEIQLSRMRGCEDGIQDAIFQFSKIIGTSYFWCPPIDETGRLRYVE